MPHIAGRWHTPAADIDALPHPFTPPSGAMVVAFGAGAPVACGSLLEFAPGIVEMKRVFVRPSARGRGVGEHLCRELIRHARASGYRHVYLDTAPELHGARSMYTRLGFTPIPPYRQGLLPDTLCFSLDLRS
jgi:ribosomal protein S18 acetylase RimI-like enzyme